jgi:hypothetical protein
VQYTAAVSTLRQGTQSLQNLCVFGEKACAVFRVDQRAVCGDIEYAAAAPDELGLDAELFGDFGRQTGGPGQITSAHAVLDRDAHRQAPRKT